MALNNNDKKCCSPGDNNREGTSLLSRFLPVLDPVNAPVDPRKAEDILVFAKHYAELVRYYDINDTIDCVPFTEEPVLIEDVKEVEEPTKDKKGHSKQLVKKNKEQIVNWKEFFYSDIAVVTASIARYKSRLDQIKAEYNDLRKKVETDPVKEKYRRIFLSIIHHLKRINRWYERSVDGHPLKMELDVKIRSFLRPALQKLMAYDKAMLLNVRDDLDLVTQYETFKSSPWGCDFDKIDPDNSVYVGDQLWKKITHALLYVDDIFNTMFKVYEEVTQRSGFYWEQAVENYPLHKPHMALFISFVELFSYAKDEMNGLTKRHLEFFYRDVLHLKEKPPHADSVYLIYQLAKGVDDFELKAGTELTAGKDGLGKTLIYKNDADFIINKASVRELKTLFLDKNSPIKNMYAAPVANSADGKGEKFKEPETAWSTFGYFDPAVTGKITGKEAEVGFAIASSQLLLSGGNRKINFNIDDLDGQPLLADNYFDIYLTGEKDWIRLEKNDVVDGYDYLVPLSEKPIIGFDPKIHSGNFSTTYPVAKFILKKTTPSHYETLKNKKIKSISIDVDVSGLIDIIIENDDGGLNPVKPFYPFTARPLIGSGFYIGAKEFVGKNIETLSANIEYNGNMDFATRYIGYIDFSLPGSNTTDSADTNKRRVAAEYKAAVKIYSGNNWVGNDEKINLFATDQNLTTTTWNIKSQVKVKKGEGFTQVLNRAFITTARTGSVANSTSKRKKLTALTASAKYSDFMMMMNRVGDGNIRKAISLLTHPKGIFKNPLLARKALVTMIKTHQEDATDKLSEVFVNEFSGTGVIANDPFVTSEGGILFSANDLSNEYPQASPSNNYRIVKLVLDDHDFGHEFYPTLTTLFLAKRKNVTDSGVAAVKGMPVYTIGNSVDPFQDIFVPAAPAEVKVAMISLNYSSTKIIKYDDGELFHIYPFGQSPVFFKEDNDFIVPLDETIFTSLLENENKTGQLIIPTNFMLPQFKAGTDEAITLRIKNLNDSVLVNHKEFISANYFQVNQYESLEDQQGNLYIGIADLLPPQNLSLLFKFADGTAYDNDNDPPKIKWSYLVNNEWISLPDGHLITDGTYGFQATGIVLIDFPAEATNNNTILTTGLHWLCASITDGGNRIPKLIDIVGQASQATFSDTGNDPLHYKDPLPEKSIAKPLVKIPEIKIIDQPFESFDGKPSEAGINFYQRVSERLRHKGRAINASDYEHLILEAFPSVYKVKVLSHTDPDCLCRIYKKTDNTNACCCPQLAPGHVLIIPVSNLRNKNAIDPLKPRTGRRTLLQIKDFLQKRVSPFVHLHTRNPQFEELKVSFYVKFYSGVDKGFHLRKLNQDIIQHLTPWAYDVKAEILFGNKIYASRIINFIEELSYVDYITCFRMIHVSNGCCEESLPDMTCDQMKVDLSPLAIYKRKLEAEPPVALTAEELANKSYLEGMQVRFINEASASSQQAILVSSKQHCISFIDEEPVTTDCNCKTV